MTRLNHSVERYAYRAEAALDLFEDAHLMRQGQDSQERLVCSLFARSARMALSALCVAEGLDSDDLNLSLFRQTAQLEQRGLFGRAPERAYRHARLLTRVLILDQQEAGAGYVTRDLFDEADVTACERSAQFFLDICTRRLLRCSWEDALLRFLPFRDVPMVDTRLWVRRAPHQQARRSRP